MSCVRLSFFSSLQQLFGFGVDIKLYKNTRMCVRKRSMPGDAIHLYVRISYLRFSLFRKEKG